MRVDPHTRSGDEHPGSDVYAIWRNLGVLTKAAAYKPNSTTGESIKPESRIELLNTLFCDATIERDDSSEIVKDGVRRLFVAVRDDGSHAAPRLVEALEVMERNAMNVAEHERKDDRDHSHWPAALAYALWTIEKPRVGMAVAV